MSEGAHPSSNPGDSEAKFGIWVQLPTDSASSNMKLKLSNHMLDITFKLLNCIFSLMFIMALQKFPVMYELWKNIIFYRIAKIYSILITTNFGLHSLEKWYNLF